jgi:hypothetical protein
LYVIPVEAADNGLENAYTILSPCASVPFNGIAVAVDAPAARYSEDVLGTHTLELIPHVLLSIDSAYILPEPILFELLRALAVYENV